MDFFGFFLFGIFLALWAYRFISFDKFGKFSVTISWSSFSTPPSFFSSGTLITQMLRLLLLPLRFLRLCCFFFFFPPFLSVDILSVVQNESFLLFYLPVYWSFFSSILLLSSFTEPLFWLLCFSVQKCQFAYSLYLLFFLLKLSISLLRLSVFFIWFKRVHNCSLKNFFRGCFQIFINNSNTSVISVLVSIDYLFKFSLREIFLVLGMMNIFWLNFGNFNNMFWDSGSYLHFLF